MTKNEQITRAIATKVAAGMDIREAYDAVLGAGAYKKMAGEMYEALRAKAGA